MLLPRSCWFVRSTRNQLLENLENRLTENRQILHGHPHPHSTPILDMTLISMDIARKLSKMPPPMTGSNFSGAARNQLLGSPHCAICPGTLKLLASSAMQSRRRHQISQVKNIGSVFELSGSGVSHSPTLLRASCWFFFQLTPKSFRPPTRPGNDNHCRCLQPSLHQAAKILNIHGWWSKVTNLARKPVNWWGSAKRDVTHPTKTLATACSENVHSWPVIDSHGRVDRDNNTTPANYVYA